MKNELFQFLEGTRGVGQLIKTARIGAREKEIADDIFQEWWLKGSIKYPEMMHDLREQAIAEGLDAERIFQRVSILCNPTRSV